MWNKKESPPTRALLDYWTDPECYGDGIRLTAEDLLTCEQRGKEPDAPISYPPEIYSTFEDVDLWCYTEELFKTWKKK